MKKTVLCFVIDRDSQKLLMIHKKRGQGAGKWNVPGGKLEVGEDLVLAAVRETREETGLEPTGLEKIGELEFHFPAGNSWDNQCTVFRAYQFQGKIIEETEECTASWVALDKIPFTEMWESDRIWAPLVFAGKYFHRYYEFDAQDKMTCEKILEETLKHS